MTGSSRSRSAPTRWMPFLVLASLAPAACLDLTIPDPPDGSPDAILPSDAPATIDLGGGGAGSGGQATGGQTGGTGGSAPDVNGAGGSGGTTTTATSGSPADGGADAAATGGAGGMLDASADERDLGSSAGGTGGGAGGAAGDAGHDAMADVGSADSRGEAGLDATADLAAPDAALDATTDTASRPLPAGLVAYYPCERAQGSLLPDESGNGHHGSLQASGTGFRFDAGKLGNGLVLVQSGSGYVSLPPAVFAGAAELTIATWVRLTTLTVWQRLFDVGVNAHLSQNTETGTAYLTLVLKDFAGKIGLTSSNNGYGNAQRLNADAFAVDTWKHVAVVLGGGGATLYVDGAAAGSITSLLPPQALGNLDYAFVGRSQFTADPFLGAEIDELRIYRRALNAAEVGVLAKYTGP